MVEGSDLSSDELEYLDGPVELAPVESPARSSIPYFPGYLHSRANAQGQSGTDSTRSARPTTSRLPTPSRPTELSHAELPSSHLPLKRSVPLSERLPRGSVPPGQSPHDSTRSGPGGASTNRKTLLSSFISADKHLKETPRVLGSSLWPRPNRVSETNPPTAFGEEQLPQSSSSKDRLVSLVSAEGSGTEEDDEEADEMPSLESRRKRARALSLRRHVRDRRVGSDHDAPNPQDAQASRGKALRTSKRQRVAKGHVRPSSYGRDESTEDEEFSPLPVFKSIKAESALQVGTNRKSPRASRKSINWSDSDGRLDDDDDDGSNESDSQPISTKKLVEMLPKRRSRSKSFPSSRKDVLSEISAEETDHELLSTNNARQRPTRNARSVKTQIFKRGKDGQKKREQSPRAVKHALKSSPSTTVFVKRVKGVKAKAVLQPGEPDSPGQSQRVRERKEAFNAADNYELQEEQVL